MGCDIHTMLVTAEPVTGNTTAVRCNICTHGEPTRFEVANFRNYMVFGLLTGGTVRDYGLTEFNLENHGKYPYPIDACGDPIAEKFVKDYTENPNHCYHSFCYVSQAEVSNLLSRLRTYKDVTLGEKIRNIRESADFSENESKQALVEYDEELYNEVEGAISCLEPIVSFMDSVTYNLWCNGRQDDAVYLLMMFDS